LQLRAVRPAVSCRRGLKRVSTTERIVPSLQSLGDTLETSEQSGGNDAALFAGSGGQRGVSPEKGRRLSRAPGKIKPQSAAHGC